MSMRRVERELKEENIPQRHQSRMTGKVKVRAAELSLAAGFCVATCGPPSDSCDLHRGPWCLSKQAHTLQHICRNASRCWIEHLHPPLFILLVLSGLAKQHVLQRPPHAGSKDVPNISSSTKCQRIEDNRFCFYSLSQLCNHKENAIQNWGDHTLGAGRRSCCKGDWEIWKWAHC